MRAVDPGGVAPVVELDGAGGRAAGGGDALVEKPEVRQAVAWAAAILEGVRPAGPRRAPRFAVALVAATEMYVCTDGELPYLRGWPG